MSSFVASSRSASRFLLSGDESSYMSKSSSASGSLSLESFESVFCGCLFYLFNYVPFPVRSLFRSSRYSLVSCWPRCSEDGFTSFRLLLFSNDLTSSCAGNCDPFVRLEIPTVLTGLPSDERRPLLAFDAAETCALR